MENIWIYQIWLKIFCFSTGSKALINACTVNQPCQRPWCEAGQVEAELLRISNKFSSRIFCKCELGVSSGEKLSMETPLDATFGVLLVWGWVCCQSCLCVSKGVPLRAGVLFSGSAGGNGLRRVCQQLMATQQPVLPLNFQFGSWGVYYQVYYLVYYQGQTSARVSADILKPEVFSKLIFFLSWWSYANSYRLFLSCV